ncbi:MAG TPA: WYL domain-containing protein, partial [Candidatus Eremiobacteraceae bacterium]|nr:WYL domain-containing protein [Candidatus Eremiobacteraceae bacterium]
MNSAKSEHIGRTARFIRLLKEIDEKREISKARLHEILTTTSDATFKRVKAELREAGYPLMYSSKDKLYHTPARAALSRPKLDPRSRAQLALVRTAVAGLGAPYVAALGEVLDILDARIAIEDPDATATLSSRRPQPRADRAFYERLDNVDTAIRESRLIQFDYTHTAGGATDQRWAKPLAMHDHDGRIYCWAIVEGEDRPKLFALDRMGAVELLEPFDPDPQWKLDDDLRYSFGIMMGREAPQEVVLDIDAKAAANVRARRWPAEIGSELLADGTLRMTFEVTLVDELIAWVLGFGGLATVIRPPHVA